MPPNGDDFIAPPCIEEISILYQDDALLLMNKPSGLLSLSGKNPANLDSVHHRLVQDFPGCSLVHRLDFGTSGIMLVARNKTINALLCQQFSERTVVKRYQALLMGELPQSEGEISAPIAKDKPNFPRMKICPAEGKPARSHFTLLAKEQIPLASVNIDATANKPLGAQQDALCLSRVEFTPLTGRTHQLRIHSQHMGHPIIGCDLYGSQLSHQLASRLMLHATQLKFNHPLSAEPMSVSSPCPF